MFSDPLKIIEQCSIVPGMDIADFGAGSGAYAFESARALMATGRVYAIDIQKDLLSKIKNDAVRRGLYNIEVVWGDIEKPNGTKLRDSCVDMVLICNLLFQLENKHAVVNEAKRILKPGGKVLIIDWTDSFGGIGPDSGMVVKKETAKSMMEKLGFSLDKEINSGSHHYGFLFKKL